MSDALDLRSGVIDVQRLAAHRDDPNLRIVDCRFDLIEHEQGPARYGEGHVPGAVHAHLERDLSGPITPQSGRHPLPDMTRFRDWLGRQGIDRETRVVAYDDNLQMASSRLWWLLRMHGHEQVAVLDGGWQAWLEQSGPVERERPRPPERRFEGEFDPAFVVGAEEIRQRLDDPKQLLVDVRAPERYSGVVEPIDPVAGHIPGAVNRPLDQNLDASGRFLDADAIRALYAPLIARAPVERQVYYCGSGVSACQPLLALHRAGLGMAKLYAGSWSEWIRDPERPIATGETP